MYADRFSNNVKGVSWEPAWSHRTVVSALLAYVCKCLSVGEREDVGAREVRVRARVHLQENAPDVFDVAGCKYWRARTYM